jgi:DNA-binding Xre family transcriptional regulator
VIKPLDTQRIISLIKSKGKKQADLATFLGFTAQRLGQILQEGDCRLSQLVKISQFLEVEPEDLINKSHTLEKTENKRQYINEKMKIIFNELADTISLVVEETPVKDKCNGVKIIEYVRLSSALDKVLNKPKPYTQDHHKEISNILNETRAAYEQSRNDREKELLKYLQEKIERTRAEMKKKEK